MAIGIFSCLLGTVVDSALAEEVVVFVLVRTCPLTCVSSEGSSSTLESVGISSWLDDVDEDGRADELLLLLLLLAVVVVVVLLNAFTAVRSSWYR